MLTLPRYFTVGEAKLYLYLLESLVRPKNFFEIRQINETKAYRFYFYMYMGNFTRKERPQKQLVWTKNNNCRTVTKINGETK